MVVEITKCFLVGEKRKVNLSSLCFDIPLVLFNMMCMH